MWFPLSIFFTSLALTSTTSLSANVYDHDKEVICYWSSWSKYRKPEGAFVTGHIDPSLCTRVIYSFLTLSDLDLTGDRGLTSDLRDLVAMKSGFHKLKVTASVGGWTAGSVAFSKLAGSKKRREIFAKNAVNFLLRHKLDGLDVDWEYPSKKHLILN